MSLRTALALVFTACIVVTACGGSDAATPDLSGEPTGPIVASGADDEDGPTESVLERSFLGTPFSGDTIANIDVGGPDGVSVSYRFLAERSGQVSSIRPYIVVNTSRLGYAAGTGGRLRLSLVADDGAGLPDLEAVLSEGEFQMNLIDGHLPEPADTEEKRAQNYPSIPLSGQPITAGETYHLVFEQIDPDPVNNYVGLDLLYQYTTELGPRPSIDSWGLAVKDKDTGWKEFTTRFGEELYTPIMVVHMEDGFVFGNGYIEPFPEPESFRQIDDSSAIQVTFETDEKFAAQRWWLRALRTSDTGFLQVDLEGNDGTSGVVQIPATDFPTEEMGWVERDWPFEFMPGVSYTLTLTGTDGGEFALHPLRQGTSYNFEPGSYFAGVSRPSDGNGGYEGWHKDLTESTFVEADIMMTWTK